MAFNKHYPFLILILFFYSCATYQISYKEEALINDSTDSKDKISFYLIGNISSTGDKDIQGLNLLNQIAEREATDEDYMLFLGDQLPKKKVENKKIKSLLTDQLESVKNLKGKKIFIPGDKDWRYNQAKGLKKQIDFIEGSLEDTKSFWPSKGCPIKSLEITEDIQLIVLDTQWYLMNWNNYPTINDDCDIKTRSKFLSEVADELKKHQGKTTIVAMHHPLFTNGPRGGVSSFKEQIFPFSGVPLPIIGTFITEIRSQGSFSKQDRFNEQYNQLMRRLYALAREQERIIFVSAQDKSLQYIQDNNIKQIISGAGHQVTPSKLGGNGILSFPKPGLAVLDVFADGSSKVRFYGKEQKKQDSIINLNFLVHKHEKNPIELNNPIPKDSIKASIYTLEETQKSKFFKFLWGNHYRNVYSTPIKLPVFTLDSLLGGMQIERRGGGQVTRSLRLVDTLGRRWSLRAMRKSVTQFLQKGAFVDTYLDNDFENTYTESLLSDFYTSSYPYAFLPVAKLAESIEIYHPNPFLLYIPKHENLGTFNSDFGDEMYFLEERPGKEFSDLESFGKPDDIEGTDDMLSNLRKNEKYKIDEAFYIRNRLFDMLIGDWDRHADQWRWARFDKAEGSVYRPIPKDRDQAFSNYDGNLLGLIRGITPSVRKFQVYDEHLENVRWINQSGIRLDRAFTQSSSKEEWQKQADFIQNELSDNAIEKAFESIPKELQDETLLQIKKYLKLRRDQLKDVANKYYDYLTQYVMITATDKDDQISIKRSDNKTKVSISRIKNEKESTPFYERTFASGETKEIWIYGLDDDDEFIDEGEGKNPIKIRIIGGQNKDEYNFQNGKKLRVYDYLSKPNTVKEKGKAKIYLADSYDENVYTIDKHIDKTTTILPLIGFNPDDGLNINLTTQLIKRGFINKPYQSKHVLNGAYFFATQGFDFSYTGSFISTLSNWNFMVGARYTSENFAQNFFGLGNTTENFDDELGLDFNRVKISTYNLNMGWLKDGMYGNKFAVRGILEGIEVQDSRNRFITSGLPIAEQDEDFFERKYFAELLLEYQYQSLDNKVNPHRGMDFSIQASSTTNVEETETTFGDIKSKLTLYNAITNNKKLVFKTSVMAQTLIGDDFEFYQAATLGGLNGLRGYREERFSGESALAFNGDLRYSFNRFKTGLLPLQLGVFTGYDIGRVWLDGEESNKWHDSIGGGFWINLLDTAAGQFGLFHSDDGFRVTFGLGINM